MLSHLNSGVCERKQTLRELVGNGKFICSVGKKSEDKLEARVSAQDCLLLFFVSNTPSKHFLGLLS